MGLVLNSLKFLLDARQSGARFDETLTLGRQHMTLSPERAVLLLRDYNLWPPPGGEESFLAELKKAQWRFELFARSLGAKNVSSMDVSGYEGATIVHDLNLPVAPALHERFDAVIDGTSMTRIKFANATSSLRASRWFCWCWQRSFPIKRFSKRPHANLSMEPTIKAC
jgi:hypothetical protein